MLNLRGARHHYGSNPSENGYLWWYRTSWIDERLKCPKFLAALILNSADLCDSVAVSSATRRLEIKNAKSYFVQGSAEIVQRLLKHEYKCSEQVFGLGPPNVHVLVCERPVILSSNPGLRSFGPEFSTVASAAAKSAPL